jgi:CBS domain containing-hemolysin-like protein
MLNALSVPLWISYYLLYPLVYLIAGVAKLLLKRFFRIRFSNEETVFTPIDLDEYIREFTLPDDRVEEVQQEIQMFQNVIDFRKAKVRECMVPRTEIIAVGVDEPVEALKEEFILHGVSRIPVFEDSVDNITGYVHSFDMFRNPPDVRSIVKPIFYVPETMLANVVLTKFISERKNIAVVVDEFGGTSGLVTMEDVIEEIFGEIEDEFDAENLVEKKISDNEYVFSARLEIDALNERYHLGIPESDDYETLAGFIIHFHESIPERGEHIRIRPFLIEILQASESRIDLVKLHLEEA